MAILQEFKAYKDANGNKIEFNETISKDVAVTFRGKNNKLIIEDGFKTAKLTIAFDCNNAVCVLRKSSFRGFIRIGEDSQVRIGAGVTCTENTYISAAENSTVKIGDDCMIAASVQIRADDAHPIFSVATGKRINMPSSIIIGNHVWLGARSTFLGGTIIDDGSVVGFGSIVKGVFPNNCILAGTPARMIRKDIAWERPHLTLAEPFYKPDSGSVKKSEYWNFTSEKQS